MKHDEKLAQQPFASAGESLHEDLEQAISQALALHQKGLLDEARQMYQAVLGQCPKHAVCLHLLGLIAYQMAEYEQAASLISSAIDQNPLEAKFYADRGVAFRKLKKFDLALQDYERAQSMVPNFFDVYLYKANLYKEMGELNNAADSLEQACLILPNDAKTRFSLGNVEQSLGWHKKAAKNFEIACLHEPAFADAYNNWGVSLRALKEYEGALKCFQKAIELSPKSHAPYNNLGLTNHDMRRFDEAVECYYKAINIHPAYFSAHNNLGQALISMGQYQRAAQCLTRALQLQNLPEAYLNRSNAFAALFEFDKALEDLDAALALDPQFGLAHVNRSMIRLLLGQFKPGWLEYEWRLKSGNTLNKPHLQDKPRWLGQESLEGKTILLIREQGFGDTLQFCRYAQAVKSLGAKVLLEVQQPLLGLLSGLKGADAVFADGQVNEAFDLYCPLMSLPLAFSTNADNVPTSQAYLRADASLKIKWQNILGEPLKKRIGLVFSGSPTHLNDANRSIEIAHLAAHLPKDAEYICLQRDLTPDQSQTLEKLGIQFFGNQIQNFSDTAALIEAVDLVITVDTSVAHLSGALGKPTWIMLPALPDWRWMLERLDSPWYACVKLYRQGNDRNWQPVFEKVGIDIASFLGCPPLQEKRHVVGGSFDHGLLLHQNGQLELAQLIYEKVLSQNPDHAQAMHFLGVIAIQKQNHVLAIELIEKSVHLNPFYAEAHCNLGLSYQALKQLGKALQSFEKAIEIKPDFSQAHNNKGYALEVMGRYDLAIQSFEHAVQIDPLYAGAHFNKGNALKNIGQLERSLESYQKAIQVEPQYAEAYNNRGVVLKELKRMELAVQSFESACQIKPQYAEAYNNCGNTLKELKRFEQSIECFDKALAIKPQFSQALNNKGFALQEMQLYERALECFNLAIELKPDFAEAYANRGNSLKKLERYEEAIQSYDHAIRLKADYAEAYYNKGVSLTELLKLQEALECYNRAITIDPSSALVFRNRAMLRLMMGQYGQGWQDYEWRWQQPEMILSQRHFSKPRWLGQEPLQQKTILLYAEQGLGDCIQFCRYTKLVQNLGAKVLLEAPAALHSLLKSLPGVERIVEKAQDTDAFDLHCPLMSLPLAFKTEIDSVPLSDGYLWCDKTLRQQWQQRLGKNDKPRVGLVWSGSTGHGNDRNRSLKLEMLLAKLPTQFDYFSLQKEVRDVDRPVLEASAVRHFGHELIDFAQTAALCDLMDLVISVDTSVAHLAAAMGKKTYLMLSYVPDWRWLLEAGKSPWYDSVQLFRQSSDRSWDCVIDRIAQELKTIQSLN